MLCEKDSVEIGRFGMWQLLLLVALPLQIQGLDLRSPCNESVHLGDEICDKTPSIRYLVDYLTCPANTPPVTRKDGTSHCDDNTKCPKGSTCRKGFIVGLCCDNKAIGWELVRIIDPYIHCSPPSFIISEKYNANQKPDCGNKKLVTDRTLGYPVWFMTFDSQE
ncbi:hypothetical protein ANCCEY_09972 [Ancylostoma ceylanicum]|uniref:Uncharacterized protein n=1 Tax=Ancylostoma ceylanicum TaxID=53326 RepID=A0A0D6LTH3_9BILA|nr:hypothetical protein ANCCEY_09972 [Ancylostoma ceylanicum]